MRASGKEKPVIPSGVWRAARMAPPVGKAPADRTRTVGTADQHRFLYPEGQPDIVPAQKRPGPAP